MGNIATGTGERLRSARIAAGHSQQTLATAAGLAIRTVARIEQGDDTKLGTLSVLAEVLGIAVTDLIADPEAERAAAGAS